ncbi:hypothetical protein ADUPG1_006805 [Aduncisulcus paluster]|uniref:Uncharacterized protein n=1 Tax=Aduncisulcus paluster TaxID=2918883 RepID=A0ABQ5KJM7_9EUKA|nr:hypothetical protein ADUPG1_006805 [Aduncisulcus paluster]
METIIDLKLPAIFSYLTKISNDDFASAEPKQFLHSIHFDEVSVCQFSDVNWKFIKKTIYSPSTSELFQFQSCFVRHVSLFHAQPNYFAVPLRFIVKMSEYSDDCESCHLIYLYQGISLSNFLVRSMGSPLQLPLRVSQALVEFIADISTFFVDFYFPFYLDSFLVVDENIPEMLTEVFSSQTRTKQIQVHKMRLIFKDVGIPMRKMKDKRCLEESVSRFDTNHLYMSDEVPKDDVKEKEEDIRDEKSPGSAECIVVSNDKDSFRDGYDLLMYEFDQAADKIKSGTTTESFKYFNLNSVIYSDLSPTPLYPEIFFTPPQMLPFSLDDYVQRSNELSRFIPNDTPYRLGMCLWNIFYPDKMPFSCVLESFITQKSRRLIGSEFHIKELVSFNELYVVLQEKAMKNSPFQGSIKLSFAGRKLLSMCPKDKKKLMCLKSLISQTTSKRVRYYSIFDILEKVREKFGSFPHLRIDGKEVDLSKEEKGGESKYKLDENPLLCESKEMPREYPIVHHKTPQMSSSPSCIIPNCPHSEALISSFISFSPVSSYPIISSKCSSNFSLFSLSFESLMYTMPTSLSSFDQQKIMKKVLQTQRYSPDISMVTPEYFGRCLFTPRVSFEYFMQDECLNPKIVEYIFALLRFMKVRRFRFKSSKYESVETIKNADTKKVLPLIIQGIAGIKMIECLDIDIFEGGKYASFYVGQMISILERLISFSLSCDKILTGSKAKYICGGLAFHNIQNLALTNCGLDDKGCLALGEILPSFRELKCLNLSHNKISSDGCKSLFSDLILEHLIIFDLSMNMIKNGCQYLVRFLQGITSPFDTLGRPIFISLKFMNCSLSPSDCIYLSLGLRDKPMKYGSFDVSYNRFEDQGVLNLVPSFASCPMILNLQGCGITDFGCKIIAEIMKRQDGLKSILLGENKIKGDGCDIIAHALPNAVSLVSIDIHKNRIPSKVLYNFIRKSKETECLTEIKITRPIIFDDERAKSLTRKSVSIRYVE